MIQQSLRNRILTSIVLVAIATNCSKSNAQQPNVLFISIDDLNDWVGVFGGHDQVKTPNLDSFARKGSVVFQNAHCPGPVCGSSRSALLSGFMPHTTGIYGNGQNMRDSGLIQQHATLPEYFSKHGYHSLSSGKIFHKHADKNGADVGHWAFDEYVNVRGSLEPDKTRFTSRDKNLIHGKPGPPTKYSAGGGSEFCWGPSLRKKEETRDFKTAQWAAEELSKPREKPFFMAVGLSKPHLPFVVPQEFFDLYDPATFKAPQIKEDDLDDILVNGKRPKHKPTNDYLWLKQNNLIDECALAYAASCSYADSCLGVIFDALEKSPHKSNTIVVVWGDHGWHLGEKLRYRKTTGWFESTRVPLVFRLPDNIGDKGQTCDRPVNLIDLYPTLVELCGLPAKSELDGRSFKPLLLDPKLAWQPTLTVFGKGNASINGERYHYLKYTDGVEEFYDRTSDPMEWENLITKLTPQQRIEKERLEKLVPAKMTPSVKSSPKNKKIRTLNEKIKGERPLTKLK